ncbi:cell division protein ZapA [Microvirga thermotolerans]|uniref:Cell division protein ZapA n=1 Tax=Microvirga thermotolerans TaxID=2651334 RepID=A0A5P9JST0_9HYPH|nr:cell division protein ZapA [Microvirga thermotolerans]QFU15463.1 cell division protein ZapA [Microvirga thermotolerans]
MPQVAVTIAGRTYRIACGEGEEAHLEALAAALDGKIAEMRATFGEIGDMRLHVMAAITIADELHEARRRLAAAEAELAELRRFASQGDERVQAVEARLAEGVLRAAERIEHLARSLSAPGQG